MYNEYARHKNMNFWIELASCVRDYDTNDFFYELKATEDLCSFNEKARNKQNNYSEDARTKSTKYPGVRLPENNIVILSYYMKMAINMK